jgi:NADH-quinone oxidoreductase subunit G
MIKIEINGQMVKAHEGDMLIDVADDAHIAIPRFCYHKKLSIAANCRMCLVEVEGAPKALPACATPVTDGMKVQTKSVKAVAAQKSVMEFLLINHPLDCPICDQGGECELQDVAMQYGDDVSRFSEAKRVVADKNIGALIHTDMTRCIHCTRCVRFGQEIGGIMELGATGRSEWMEIGTYIEQSVISEMSGNMIDLCPVGALTSKPYRYSARPWELKSHHGISPHDSIGSNIIIHAKGNDVKRVVPADKESINEVWLSDRDRFAYEGINSEDRLTAPMIKENGKWRQVDWETALQFSADKLKHYAATPEMMGVLASPTATLEELYLLQKIARGLGVNNLDTRLRQQDFSLDSHGFVKPELKHSFAEVEKLDATLLVGSYLRHELPMLNHRLRKAQLAGKIVSSINTEKFEINYEINNEVVADDLLAELQLVVDALEKPESNNIDKVYKKIASSLSTAGKSSIMLGQISLMDVNFTKILKLTSDIARLSGAVLNVLPISANDVGAYMVNFLPEKGKNIQQMLTTQMKAFVNLSLEAESDITDGKLAIEAMRKAEFVLNFSLFDSEIQREYADVLLPIASFAETAGTFVNAMGTKQSFKMAVEPQGDSKAAWKVFRVLGNMLDLEGFDYTHSNQVFAEVLENNIETKNELVLEKIDIKIDKKKSIKNKTPLISIYEVDSITRRATALKTASKAVSETIIVTAPVQEVG